MFGTEAHNTAHGTQRTHTTHTTRAPGQQGSIARHIASNNARRVHRVQRAKRARHHPVLTDKARTDNSTNGAPAARDSIMEQ
jgi:hypothetical protein